MRFFTLCLFSTCVCVAAMILLGKALSSPPSHSEHLSAAAPGSATIAADDSQFALPAEVRLQDSRNPVCYYRLARPDDLGPGQIAVIRQQVRFRKPDVDDRGRKGQVLGMANPALAMDDLAVKQAKLESAAADVFATVAMKEKETRRLNSILSLRTAYPRSVPDDDCGITRVAAERYTEEEVSKRSAVVQAQRELPGALTTLNMQKRTSVQ